jgi:hypothetical protein
MVLIMRGPIDNAAWEVNYRYVSYSHWIMNGIDSDDVEQGRRE